MDRLHCATLLSQLCLRHLIRGPGKRHKAYGGNGARPRLTRCDLFDNRELLGRIGRSQRHDEPTAHFELFKQRRRDMVKRGCHDHCVERTTFRASKITVADLDTHIVI